MFETHLRGGYDHFLRSCIDQFITFKFSCKKIVKVRNEINTENFVIASNCLIYCFTTKEYHVFRNCVPNHSWLGYWHLLVTWCETFTMDLVPNE